MALRQILITRKLAELEEEKTAKLAEREKITERRAAWKEREKRATEALREMNDKSTKEEKDAFEDEVKEIEDQDKEIADAEEEADNIIEEIEEKIEDLKEELETIEERAKKANQKRTVITKIAKREGEKTKMNRFTPEYRDRCGDLASRAEVKEFLRDMRDMATRGITNTTLTVPVVMLPTLRDRIDTYSKLTPFVNVKPIRGTGKQNIIGSAPEAVWTETLGKFNELTFNIAQEVMDGHKVAGYIPVPNPYLQDSDEDLAALVMDMLGQAIGLAKDKAILYGTGSNMPIGIVPRLVAATSPTWWGTNAPTFTNLSTSNVGKLSAASVTGIKVLQEAFKVLGKIKPKYNTADESVFWAMSHSTWMNVKVETMSLNSAGAVVAGVSDEMPILGGKVVELDFMPDNVIVGGYGGHYLLGERNEIELRKSEHVRFLEDQTVFAGVARYDGRPLAGEAFAAFSLTTTAVSGTAVTFATDSANATQTTPSNPGQGTGDT